MYNIVTSEHFRDICPEYVGICIEAYVVNGPTCADLWSEIEDTVKRLRTHYTPDTIKQRPAISAIRLAYKRAGKDPSRYRPACEQLARRVLQGKSLYIVDSLVDLGNLVSLDSGYATAVIDADKISGEHIELNFGKHGEPYEGIGRGVLNIENLPVYRDEVGAFATPTSDSTRTMVSAETRHILLIINGFDGNKDNLSNAISMSRRLLEQYVKGDVQRILYY